jgi:drug/metabolite transporter (DMT)-like permease
MKSNILLLITAMIWGFAFVAQRSGMEHLGPFTFNSIRFALGGISLLPILLLNKKRKSDEGKFFPFSSDNILFKGGIIAGIILFFGASFQQIGIVYTTAGKAGFITGLYIVLVPIFGIAFRQQTSGGIWLGAIVAVIGLYLLSVRENFSIGLGDILVLSSAFFWSFHVLVISRFSPKTDPIRLAFMQFILCAILSFIAALFTETSSLQNVIDASIPILYAGIVSVGIAYTLQVVAQKEAHPSHAAIIMSLESVFAVIGGWVVLNESIPLRGLIGCALMLAGMIISQISLTPKILKIKSRNK